MENFDYRGYWWLPETGEEQVAGSLSFSNAEGLKLSLMGEFDKGSDLIIRAGETETIPIILGIVEGKLVTLVGCMSSGTGFSSPGFMRTMFRPTFAFVSSEHFPDPYNIQLNSVSIQLSHLPDWAPRLSGGHIRVETRENDLHSFSLTYSMPDNIIMKTDAMTISLGVAVSFPFAFSRDFALRETLVLRASREDSMTLDWWLSRFVNPMQNLLSLATNHPNSILQLSVMSPSVTAEISKDRSEQVPFEVYYRSRYQDELSQAKQRLMPHEMLFTFDDVQDRIERMIGEWLNVAEHFSDSCNRFFAVHYRSMYSEHRFENMAQALEGFHRASSRFSNQIWSDAEYESLRSSLMDSCPAESRSDWLEPWLRFANEPSLRRRLKEICNDIPDVVDTLVGIRKNFIDNVVSARNAIAHPHGSSQSPGGIELYLMSRQLGFIFQACLLQELELPLEYVTRQADYKFEAKRSKTRKLDGGA